MELIEKFLDEAKTDVRSIVLPEARDARILEAAGRLKDAGIAEPVLAGGREDFEKTAAESGTDVSGIRFIDPAESDLKAPCIERYIRARGAKRSVAEHILSRPLYFAGMMVAHGGDHGDSGLETRRGSGLGRF